MHLCACAHELITPLHGLSCLVVDLYTSRTWAMALCDIAQEASTIFLCVCVKMTKPTSLLHKSLRLKQCLFPAQTSRMCGSA